MRQIGFLFFIAGAITLVTSIFIGPRPSRIRRGKIGGALVLIGVLLLIVAEMMSPLYP